MSHSLTQDDVIKNLELRLGGQMIDIELDPEHYNYAVDRALKQYRRRSAGASEETFIHLDIVPEVQEYVLPSEVQEVRAVRRRNIGNTSVSNTTMDPFDLAFTNAYVLGAMASGNGGGMASFYLVSAFRETMGKLFGAELNFFYENRTKKLTIHRHLRNHEKVLVHVYNAKPDEALINDDYAGTWIEDYALAHCKIMIGEARDKFQSLPGASGTTMMNGSAMKSEGLAELERLEEELKNYSEGNDPLGFIIG